jgi:hypothetical protein
MADPTGDANRGALRLDFDRRLLLQFRGSAITSDAGLLPYRELDDALSLTDMGADVLSDTRTGGNAAIAAARPAILGFRSPGHPPWATFVVPAGGTTKRDHGPGRSRNLENVG